MRCNREPGTDTLEQPEIKTHDRILPKLRRGKVLTGAQFGCLKGIPTLNVTQGCLFRCSYCYARGYPEAPPKGTAYLYMNLPGLVRKELLGKKSVPRWVALNTSSDCFQSHPDILDLTFELIQMLFDHGVGVSFLTKGSIPQRFIRLFKQLPDKVLAQVGIVSLSERYWKEYEIGTPAPEKRLETVRNLIEIGILPEIRIDPIIPFITDTEAEATALFVRLRQIGIKRITLSYLHLRPAIHHQLKEELTPLHRRVIESCFNIQEYSRVGPSVRTKLLPRVLRETGYSRIKEIAERFEIASSICRCKNPDLEADLCGSGRIRADRERTTGQLPLFQC